MIDNFKTIKELIGKFKGFSPSIGSFVSAQGVVIGTSISNESTRLGQVLDIYKGANKKYEVLHSRNPGQSKGVTVNMSVVIGTNGGGYTNISIYDISTRRYLNGGQILHRR